MGSIRMRAGSRARKQVRQQLVDDVFDAYRRWRDESAEVRRTYDRWASSARDVRRTWRDDYRAALEREESAACLYEQLLGRLAA
jgi:hypothetical protein